jgi:hypothetical protein
MAANTLHRIASFGVYAVERQWLLFPRLNEAI